MDKDFVEKMRLKLDEMKRDILKTLASEDAEFRDLVKSDEVKDSADIASADIDSKTLAILGQQDLKRLRLIESALARIANNTYGRCLKSGKNIAKERLEAVPYALYCVDVQNEIEKQRHRV